MKILILDTETTGISNTDQVIELAYYKTSSLKLEKDFLSYIRLDNEVVTKRYKPTVPINPHAYNVHGINIIDVIKCTPSGEINILEDVTHIIGHNINFDKRLLLQSNKELSDILNRVTYICTLDIARYVSKYLKINFGGHKLDTLFSYYYPEHIELLTPTHSAKYDVIKTMLVLLKLINHLPNIETWEDLDKLYQNLKELK